MPLATRNSRRSSIDIWPGFVDALAQLLMVIIFILLVFTAGQFYLGIALSGRDQALQQLQQQVDELANLLAVERATGEELRSGSAELSAKLKGALAERDQLTGKLRDADAIVSADKEKIELQLRELESLRRDLAALKSVRADLEAKVAAPRSAAGHYGGAARPLEGAGSPPCLRSRRRRRSRKRKSMRATSACASSAAVRTRPERRSTRREGNQPHGAGAGRRAECPDRQLARAAVADRGGARRL